MTSTEAISERQRKKLTLRIPGSTSNLGPGFDTFALALGIYCRLTFRLLEKEDPSIPFITFKGQISTGSRATDADALIDRVLRKFWKDDPELVKCTRITIDSEIPLGAGLGSSDAIVIGALWAAYAFRDLVPTADALLAEAATLEGHGESMAASLLGQFVVCARAAGGTRLVARSHPWPPQWKTLLVVPRSRVRTVDARAVLPAKVPFEDAVANVQRAALLVSAVTGSHDLALKEALNDRLHEPYRDEIAPLLSQIRGLLLDEPILGAVLSGAGPSVLVIAHERSSKRILARLNEWASQQPEPPAILDLAVDTEGIKELGQPGRPPAHRAG